VKKSYIAKPIPIKRELKLERHVRDPPGTRDCRAYPDEKGIETAIGMAG